MNTAWYILRIDDAGETLMRCSPTGFETVPFRDPMPQESVEEEAPPIQADTPEVHSPYEPNDAGKWVTAEHPRATDAVNDIWNTDDPAYRYMRNIGAVVEEAIAPDPAPLYVAMDEERSAMFEMVGRVPIRAIVDGPHKSLSTLWSETKELEVQA